MAESIICPVCGEANPADMEFCRNCQSRLRPLTGALKNEAAPIQPGEPPTKKLTSELEPLLPQWLREARRQARDSATEGSAEPQEPERQAPEPTGPDLLAGLASQASEDEEEVPDWLTHITGAQSKKKKPATEDNQVKWVELGHGAEPPLAASDVESSSLKGAPEHDELTDWFKQATPSSQTADFRSPNLPFDQSPVGTEADQPTQPSKEEDLSWLRNLDAGAATEPEPPAAPPPPVPADIPDWLKQLQTDQAPTQTPPPPAAQPIQPPQAQAPDWLKGLGAESSAPIERTPPADVQPLLSQGQLPDWLKGTTPSAPPAQVDQVAADEAPAPAELPDWLSALGTAQQPQEETKPTLPAFQTEEPAVPSAAPSTGLPDWLSALGTAQEPPQEAPKPAPSVFEGQEPAAPSATPSIEMPDWLSELGTAQPAQEETKPTSPVFQAGESPASGAPASIELPDWLSALGAAQPPQEETKPTPSVFHAEEASAPGATPAAELPDWISALGTKPEDLPAEAPSALPAAELPDWVSALRPQEEPTVQQPTAPPLPEPPDWASTLRAEQEAPTTAEPITPTTAGPEVTAGPVAAPGAAFTDDAFSSEDADAAFASMQTPEWLSSVLPASAAGPDSTPVAAEEEEAIGPAELPSWVQAMRPVESAMAGAPPATENVPTEERGPLAGLRGVLPAIPGAALPSSKPKAHSIKLDASEQQQAHAVLLEQILAAETSPIPMRSAGAVLRSQRVLRWALSALVLLVVGWGFYTRAQNFPLPSGVPNETVGAIQAVEAIPANAPVLVVFDYQPATVGEMEASGASLLDHLLVLHPPHLVLLSTSPTGPALAERFMSAVLVDNKGNPKFASGSQYIDLGYLPGGITGVYKFAQNPAEAVPLDVNSQPAWRSAFMAPVQKFSDFAAIIVLTDSMESGRQWVEQTQGNRGKSSMVFVASAQAAPMLLPYVDSGQVNGMVSGVSGAAGVEQRNAGSPAVYGLPGAPQPNPPAPGYVRRYWDAYSIGLYLAVMLIILGTLWNLWLGFRERRADGVG